MKGQITQLLAEWQQGEPQAFDRLLPLVYSELRDLANAQFARERPGHTLQPTALVHEAWIRLMASDAGTVESRTHFFAAAARVMRRLLVEHARRRLADKRDGQRQKITLELDQTPAADEQPDVLDVHRALDELSQVNGRQARLVELRYFGGLTVPESARILGISQATAERDWTASRLWLRRRLASLS